MKRHSYRTAGITLVEVATLLTVLAILASVLTPTVSGMINKSKVERAHLDINAIKQGILNMLSDTNALGIVQDGSLERGDQVPVELLVSDGDIPAIAGGASSKWGRPVDFKTVDFIANHLATNTPGGQDSHAYKTWNGAYIPGPIRSDPWGNRYMVNVKFLAPGNSYDVVVISAGPDEEIDSKFTQDGFVVGDDDIISMISSGTLPSTGG